MDQAKPGAGEAAARVCVCCGAASVSRSIPACWPHWELLPEDLRSAIVISYGRVELKVHAETLLKAIKVWRLAGAWRPRARKVVAPTFPSVPEIPATERRVISLDERRRKSARPANSSLPADEAEDRAARSRS